MEIQAIKTHLKAHKITYEQLSEKSKIPLNTLKNIFSGRTPNPRIDTMQAIQEALGLPQQPLEWTDTDKAEGVVSQYAEKLAPDETELIDLYRAVKSEKGERAAFAIKTLIKTYLDGK